MLVDLPEADAQESQAVLVEGIADVLVVLGRELEELKQSALRLEVQLAGLLEGRVGGAQVVAMAINAVFYIRRDSTWKTYSEHETHAPIVTNR